MIILFNIVMIFLTIIWYDNTISQFNRWDIVFQKTFKKPNKANTTYYKIIEPVFDIIIFAFYFINHLNPVVLFISILVFKLIISIIATLHLIFANKMTIEQITQFNNNVNY